ncbi:hypothetical protein CTTA_0947 [Comamonas testosteroni]|uniref:Uncharacterized protein n=1 Tax=Comamonas testosteroni TaxID=285 RepID=A0A5A7M8A3_COMTE|nr:hypothetical protein [Comamonas testosteroni]GEQ73942.1 hypothetical protein CTTA_0947 [Comamonas testosteroni]
MTGGGGLFPQLSRLLEVAEAHADAWSEAHQPMVWAVFCALHKDAALSFKAGRGRIAKSDLDMRHLRQKYQESLFASSSHYPRRRLCAYRRELATWAGSRQSLKPAHFGKLSPAARLQH